MKNTFSKVTSFIDQSVQEKQIPGAVVGVVTPNAMPYIHFSGFAHTQKGIEMKEDTIFDLASLTKVAATLPVILTLLEDGKLDLDDPVHRYIPQFEVFQKEITIKHLLTHTSGFPPEIKFYENDYTLEESIHLISQIKSRMKTGEQVIYSDLNFIVLGYMVKKLTGMSLAAFANKKIYEPLGMSDTHFNPPFNKINRIAATEFISDLQEYQWGKVHDENANHFHGVSGHAGLFSTVQDLSKFARMILNGGTIGNQKILSKQTIDLSKECQTQNLNLRRGIGWQLYDQPSFSGQYLQNGFGHTGFTGTSIWFDGEQRFAVIILTNRVHFGRETDISRFRRITHNLISLVMEDEHEVKGDE
ncbi:MULTISPECIES: serine hydrolase domain-containing protein [Bacillaceae]|uniref:serine hydrolase domain-containing protein n=1 Tax=Bacillaceae TaxID=186817 RepID=UPI000BA53433|nr:MULTISPECIES: serine hydrolase domain-containing protein [Bacillaceae]PAE23903.1 hypothetical protein CHI10_15785 [Bacillus sp. 7894-2]URM34771.1 beta-lactamase family protein [Cytobacillus firmus]